MSDDTEFDNESLTLTSEPGSDTAPELPEDPEEDDDNVAPPPPQPPQIVLSQPPPQRPNIDITLPRGEQHGSNVSSLGSEVSPRIVVHPSHDNNDLGAAGGSSPRQRRTSSPRQSPQQQQLQTLRFRRPTKKPKRGKKEAAAPVDTTAGGKKAVLETKTYKLTYSKTLQIDSILAFPRERRSARRSASSTSRSSSRSLSSRGSSRNKNGKKKKKRKKGKKKRKKKKKKVSIDIDNFLVGGGGDTTDGEDPGELVPPPELSPRSAAEYARAALKRAAMRRKLRRKKRKDKKEKKKKRKRRKRRKKRKKDGEDEEGGADHLVPASKQDQHFYPTPRSLLRKRCMFVTESTPVQCSICSGIHYRLVVARWFKRVHGIVRFNTRSFC